MRVEWQPPPQPQQSTSGEPLPWSGDPFFFLVSTANIACAGRAARCVRRHRTSETLTPRGLYQTQGLLHQARQDKTRQKQSKAKVKVKNMIGTGGGFLAGSVKHDEFCVRLGSPTVQRVGRFRCTTVGYSSIKSWCAVDGGFVTGMVGSSPAYGCPRVFPTAARHTLMYSDRFAATI